MKLATCALTRAGREQIRVFGTRTDHTDSHGTAQLITSSYQYAVTVALTGAWCSFFFFFPCQLPCTLPGLGVGEVGGGDVEWVEITHAPPSC